VSTNLILRTHRWPLKPVVLYGTRPIRPLDPTDGFLCPANAKRQRVWFFACHACSPRPPRTWCCGLSTPKAALTTSTITGVNALSICAPTTHGVSTKPGKPDLLQVKLQSPST
jgi:hypothetical protein